MARAHIFLLLAASLLLALAGCRPPQETPASPPPPIPTSPPPATATLQPSPLPPTPEPPQPANTPPLITTVTPSNPSSGASSVKIFLVAIDDGGISGRKIGCNDSLVPVLVPTGPTQAALRAAYEQLFAIKSEQYGQSGLYNSLYRSDLKVEKLALENGEAVVRLAGSLVMGGECDTPRVQAQLEETALQFSTVHKVTIYINGKLLKDILSLKG